MNTLNDTQTACLEDLLPTLSRIARQTAYRYAGHEADALLSVAVIAVTELLADWDCEVKVARYALSRGRGAMLDEIRRQRWAPRLVGDRARDIERARASAEQRLGRRAELGDIADELDLSMVDFLHLRDRGVVRRPVSGASVESLTHAREPNPEDLTIQAELKAEVRAAVAALPPREARVVQLTVLEERPLRRAARELQVTDSRVSQLRRRASERLADSEALRLAA